MCHKTFKPKDKFKIHVDTVHGGEGPFSCEECSKTVVASNAHLKAHMGERPFQCQICEKRNYSQKETHLKRHVKVHTEEKPFSCDICNESFSQSLGPSQDIKQFLLYNQRMLNQQTLESHIPVKNVNVKPHLWQSVERHMRIAK